MKILIDTHHQGLTEALHLLFSNRLGYEVYIQTGLEWRDEGYWAVQPFEATARQYLEPGSQPYPEYNPLNIPVKEEAGIVYVKDFSTGRMLKGITYDKFLETDFDLILASIPQHAEPFKKLASLKNCPTIMQIGNAWTFDNSFPIKNILASAKIPPLPGFNVCEWHEEFDTDIFSYAAPQAGRKIYSFINCLSTADIYRDDWILFLQLEELLPEFEFKSFGGSCRNGSIGTIEEMAAKMKEATFIYQNKRSGDGFGFNIFCSAAIGRSLITRYSDYKGKLAEPLIEDGITSIITDNRAPEQIAAILRNIASRPTTTLDLMSKNIYGNFRSNVNFDQEEQMIRQMLSNLI